MSTVTEVLSTANETARWPGTRFRGMSSSRIAASFGVLAVAMVVFASCTRNTAPPIDQLRAALVEANVEPLQSITVSPELYDLGAALFFDPILSGNRDVSCATCHEPSLATVDAQSLAIGTSGLGRGDQRVLANAFLHVPRNSPDLFNRGDDEWHVLFWDGRVSTVGGSIVSPAGDAMPASITSVQVAQAMVTIASPIEMRGFPGDEDVNGDLNELALLEPGDWQAIWDATFARLLDNDQYRRLLGAAYPTDAVDSLGLEHAVRALIAFQSEAFSSTGSPFDLFLAGDDDSLTALQIDGALLFYGRAECASCHSGSLLTDQEFYSIAAPQVGPGRGEVAPLDAGIGALDGSGSIRFRTPPLRNVVLTAPYLHDGAYWDLADVIRHHLDPLASLVSYDPLQLRDDVAIAHLDETREVVAESLSRALTPHRLSAEEVSRLVAFLESLTDPGISELERLIPFEVPSGLDLYPESTD